jgi:hypothetical protein
MVISVIGKCTYVINVDVHLFNAGQCAFHNGLSNVGRAFESHWESCILVIAKQQNDGGEVLSFFVKLKGIVLHTNVKFSKKLVP